MPMTYILLLPIGNFLFFKIALDYREKVIPLCYPLLHNNCGSHRDVPLDASSGTDLSSICKEWKWPPASSWWLLPRMLILNDPWTTTEKSTSTECNHFLPMWDSSNRHSLLQSSPMDLLWIWQVNIIVWQFSLWDPAFSTFCLKHIIPSKLFELLTSSQWLFPRESNLHLYVTHLPPTHYLNWLIRADFLKFLCILWAVY